MDLSRRGLLSLMAGTSLVSLASRLTEAQTDARIIQPTDVEVGRYTKRRLDGGTGLLVEFSRFPDRTPLMHFAMGAGGVIRWVVPSGEGIMIGPHEVCEISVFTGIAS